MLILILLHVFVVCISGTIVTLKYGQVEGEIQHSYNNKSFIAFEGIPYAKPPIGHLRFKKAEFPDNWDGILKANQTHTCIQYLPLPVMGLGLIGAEDCLYINVYVSGEEINPNANYDIVVFIHGGSFILGSPKMMGGPLYIMNKNVIYVSFNYRLGILGFLSTEDDVVPGNNGLKDQNLALRWIQENINAFGGNPESVTLVGLSAGGASVHYHYLSAQSKGLFHRGICMSGTALNTWALVKNPRENAMKLGRLLNCDSEDSAEMVECLRTKSAHTIGHAILDFFEYLNLFPIAPFGPVIENSSSNAFISEHPCKILMEGNITNDVPLIISTVQDEGIYPVGVFKMMNKLDDVNHKWEHLAPYLLNYHDVLEDNKKEELFSDRLFFIDIQKAALLHATASTAPVYFYFYSYHLHQFNIFNLNGVAHWDDGKLIFNLATSPKQLKETDEKVMNFLTTLVESYASHGASGLEEANWMPVFNNIDGAFNYLHIASGDDIKMEKIEEFAPREFWNSLHFHENERLFQNELYI